MNNLDLITRKLSQSLIIDEEIINKVITFQFKSGKKASHIHNELEFTDLGIFKFKSHKGIKEIKRITNFVNKGLSKSIDEKNRELYLPYIEESIKDLSLLYKKQVKFL